MEVTSCLFTPVTRPLALVDLLPKIFAKRHTREIYNSMGLCLTRMLHHAYQYWRNFRICALSLLAQADTAQCQMCHAVECWSPILLIRDRIRSPSLATNSIAEPSYRTQLEECQLWIFEISSHASAVLPCRVVKLAAQPAQWNLNGYWAYPSLSIRLSKIRDERLLFTQQLRFWYRTGAPHLANHALSCPWCF